MTISVHLTISAQPAHARPTACSRARARQRKPAQQPRPIRALSAAPRPAVRALSPAPRPQPGPGPGFRPCALSRLGCGAGPVARGRPSPSDGCPRASRDQNPSDRRGALDLASFGFALSLSSPLSPHHSVPPQQKPSEELRRRESSASPGAVSGPLAGVRAPQWVNVPPSSGLVAAP